MKVVPKDRYYRCLNIWKPSGKNVCRQRFLEITHPLPQSLLPKVDVSSPMQKNKPFEKFGSGYE